MSGGKKFGPACLCLLALAGCVERTFTITSEPPGALVFVSSVEKGRTPLVMPFTWYGDYEIVLRMEGHQTLTTHYKIDPPAYEIPPLDLLSELAPWTYHDRRSAHFTLQKLIEPTESELIRRAEELRARNQQRVSGW